LESSIIKKDEQIQRLKEKIQKLEQQATSGDGEILKQKLLNLEKSFDEIFNEVNGMDSSTTTMTTREKALIIMRTFKELNKENRMLQERIREAEFEISNTIAEFVKNKALKECADIAVQADFYPLVVDQAIQTLKEEIKKVEIQQTPQQTSPKQVEEKDVQVDILPPVDSESVEKPDDSNKNIEENYIEEINLLKLQLEETQSKLDKETKLRIKMEDKYEILLNHFKNNVNDGGSKLKELEKALANVQEEAEQWKQKAEELTSQLDEEKKTIQNLRKRLNDKIKTKKEKEEMRQNAQEELKKLQEKYTRLMVLKKM